MSFLLVELGELVVAGERLVRWRRHVVRGADRCFFVRLLGGFLSGKGGK